MAKVIITITDTDDGLVDINLKSDKPISEETVTTAQYLGVLMLKAATDQGEAKTFKVNGGDRMPPARTH